MRNAVSVSSRVRTAPTSATHRARYWGSNPTTMDQTHPALDPAHRARELDRIAAQRIGRRAQARGLLGVRHHRFEGIEGARKPSGQTVGQQAEGGVTFGAVPASDACSARGLARVGPVACQRTSPVGVIRAALKPCIAPRLGNNVLLAGKPRLVAKLHRPWPGGGLPARANSSLFRGAPRLRRRPSRRQAVTMWTRPSDRAPSYGACGQAMEKLTLPHRLPTLGALAPTSSPLLQQRFMRKAPAPAVPALLRHPRKSVYGILRPIHEGVPRGNARNNSPGCSDSPRAGIRCTGTVK